MLHEKSAGIYLVENWAVEAWVKETVLMKVNASIMEGTSQKTQNRFYKVFSKTLIERLSRANRVIAKYIEKKH